MKRLFTLAAAAVLFGTGIVGCSSTAEGAKEDASKDTAAVTNAAGAAVDKTVQGTAKAVNATEKGAATAAAVTENAAATAVDATKNAADKTVAATENAAATAVDATKNAADKTVAATENAAAKAGEVATHTGKVLTITPKVKSALLVDKTIYPTADASKINVDTDSDGVTIHIKGSVPNNEAKKKATEVAKAAVAGEKTQYKISNELTVASH